MIGEFVAGAVMVLTREASRRRSADDIQNYRTPMTWSTTVEAMPGGGLTFRVRASLAKGDQRVTADKRVAWHDVAYFRGGAPDTFGRAVAGEVLAELATAGGHQAGGSDGSAPGHAEGGYED